MSILNIRESQEKILRDIFQSVEEVEEVIIFGSRALNTNKNGSDLDLALKGQSVDLNTVLSIKEKLDDKDFIYKTDLVIYSEIQNQDLKKHIDRHGKKLL